ncbi:hypothetical protein [Acinetobacter tianfuensis]|uniref:hypothetical protein n=1 Tax=Acinetobacter tianfuensis TaxID=2419603 RepID=UPI0011C497EE|nr:hypothetical protein [Acinetobacter tianfuensis]
MEFLSFNGLKLKLSDLYKRNVDNVEIIDLVIENKIPLFALANGFYVGEYVKSADKIAIKKIHKDIRYVELFESNKLNSLMSGDLEKLSICACKSLYGKEIECDGFIFLPKDIYERLVFRQPEKEALSFPCWQVDMMDYYDQSEIILEITCNSLYIPMNTLSSVLDGTEISTNEDFDDCAVLEGNQKKQRDARDKRGMARIIAKYVESLQTGEYKAVDIADKVIAIMNEFNANQTDKAEYMKRWIGCVLDEKARNPGIRKLKKD